MRVVGLMCLLFGAVGLVACVALWLVSGALDSIPGLDMGSAFKGKAYAVAERISLLLSGISSVVLLAVGFGLHRRAGWALGLGRGWAIGTGVLTIVSALVSGVLVLPSLFEAGERMPVLQGSVVVWSTVSILVVGVLLMLALPVTVYLVLGSGSVRRLLGAG